MKFNFKINIEKKHILGLFILFGIAMIALVIAQTTMPSWGDSHLTWHTANDTKVKIGDLYYSLQTLINEGWLVNRTGLANAIADAIANLSVNGGESGTRKLLEFTTPYAKDSVYVRGADIGKTYYQDVCPANINGQDVNFVFLKNTNPLESGVIPPGSNIYDINASAAGIRPGKIYDFYCTYGSDINTLQYHRILLTGNYDFGENNLIATGAEPPVTYTNFQRRGITRDWRGSWKAYGWYVSLKNGLLEFQIKSIQNECTQQIRNICIPGPVFEPGNEYWGENCREVTETTCSSNANDCPTYSVLEDFCIIFGCNYNYVQTWSGINCTVYGESSEVQPTPGGGQTPPSNNNPPASTNCVDTDNTLTEGENSYYTAGTVTIYNSAGTVTSGPSPDICGIYDGKLYEASCSSTGDLTMSDPITCSDGCSNGVCM